MNIFKKIFSKGIYFSWKFGKYGLTLEEREEKKRQAREEPLFRGTHNEEERNGQKK